MAKQIIYGEEARKAIERGVNQLADTVKNNPRPQGPQRRSGQEVRLSPDYERRRYHRKGDRAWRTLSRTWAHSSSRKSPPRLTTLPVTAPPPQPFWLRP